LKVILKLYNRQGKLLKEEKLDSFGNVDRIDWFFKHSKDQRLSIQNKPSFLDLLFNRNKCDCNERFISR
jgi:hypothetical protein